MCPHHEWVCLITLKGGTYSVDGVSDNIGGRVW